MTRTYPYFNHPDSPDGVADRTHVIHVAEMADYPDAIYIGSAIPPRGFAESRWANPYRAGEHGSRRQVIEHYYHALHRNPGLMRQLPDLRDKPLACWCRATLEHWSDHSMCHGDILVDLLRDYSDAHLHAWSL